MPGLGFDSQTYYNQESIANQETVNNALSPYKNSKRVTLYDSSGNEIVPVGVASSLGDGRKTVTTAGTAVQLAPSTSCKSVTIVALQGNTGVIVVGGSTVVASAATRRGVPLNPLDTIKIFVTNLNAVWLDSTVNGEGVSFLYEI